MAAWRLAGISAAAFWSAVRAAVHSFPIVSTPLGNVRGVDYGDFLAFKGLPYAESPKRFAPPVAKRPWPKGVTWDATHFGDACASAGSHTDADPLESYAESEDCLFANVWAPKASSQGLPVVVWIHGGGFMTRTSSYAGYWGDGVVTKPEHPVLLVTFNYRLGIFGFFSSEDAGANFGFQDQQLLLRWVQDNIAAFGGDPHRVTVMGQSAGAMSVLCHLAAPGSRGLFHRAAASSPVGLRYRSLRENAPFVRTVAGIVGCGGARNVTACLRSKPWRVLKAADIAPEYLLHLESPCPECDNVLPWMPVVDGATLPRPPPEAIRRGEHSHVPTLISTVRNETLAFVPTPLMALGNNRPVYETFMKLFFKDRVSEVERHYETSPDTRHMASKTQLIGIATSDALMTCYARFLVKLLSQRAPAFLSTFVAAPTSSEMHQNRICTRGPPDGATCHAADISYQFPLSARMSSRTGLAYRGSKEASLARSYAAAMSGYAAGDAGFFEAYDASRDIGTTWSLDGAGKSKGYHRSHCDFLESIGFPQSPWGSSEAVGTSAEPGVKFV